MLQTKHRGNRRSKHRNDRPCSREPSEETPAGTLPFVQRFWFEIWAFCFFAVGVFLLVEKLQIKVTVWRWLVGGARDAVGFLETLWGWITRFPTGVELSDIVGIGLIVVSAGLLAYGMRARAIVRSLPLTDGSPCPGPKCDGVVRRARRTFYDRLVQTVLRVSVRPYACRDCSFRCVVWKRFGAPS